MLFVTFNRKPRNRRRTCTLDALILIFFLGTAGISFAQTPDRIAEEETRAKAHIKILKELHTEGPSLISDIGSIPQAGDLESLENPVDHKSPHLAGQPERGELLLASAAPNSWPSLSSGQKALTSHWEPTQTAPPHPSWMNMTTAALTATLLLLATYTWHLWRRQRVETITLVTNHNCLLEQISGVQALAQATGAEFWEYSDAPESKMSQDSTWKYAFRLQPDTVNDWMKIMHPADREHVRSTFMAYIHAGGRDVYQTEYRIRTQNGSWRWVLVKAQTVAWNAQGKPSRILGLQQDSQQLSIAQDDNSCTPAISWDATRLKNIQDMMIQSEKMLALGGIAAGIAHEINNPLGVVLQAAQTLSLRLKSDFPKNQGTAAEIGLDINLLERYLQTRKIHDFVRDIEAAAARAAEIVRHMLHFSRKSESRRAVCSLPTIIDRALELAASDYDLKKKYDFKQIRIIRDYKDSLPEINCTETEIEQVLLNLLRNAAQATIGANPPIADPYIRISTHQCAQSVRIEIADNGPGISPQHAKRIFEPFFTTKEAGSGTGLGLSVSYFIVTKGHGGQMHVCSPPEGGTIFTVELPWEKTQASDLPS